MLLFYCYLLNSIINYFIMYYNFWNTRIVFLPYCLWKKKRWTLLCLLSYLLTLPIQLYFILKVESINFLFFPFVSNLLLQLYWKVKIFQYQLSFNFSVLYSNLFLFVFFLCSWCCLIKSNYLFSKTITEFSGLLIQNCTYILTY